MRPRATAVVLAIALLAGMPGAWAVRQLAVLALFENKALLQVDGERRLLRAGETSPDGVTLISADSGQAVIEVDGRQETLTLGMSGHFPGSEEAAESPSWGGPETVSLWADGSGFFYASGRINDYPVRFLVDTGANSIAMNAELARRIGIDLQQGQRGVATTAGGITPMVGVTLSEVTVGGITLRDVKAGVLMGPFPEIPLLGMSFLGRLDMVREGHRMDLKRRY